jgi:CRISPR-associated protein Cas2
MMVLVSYDVSTRDAAGERRLRRVSRACQDYGQRVQFSVFEIEIDPDQWAVLKQRLLDLIDGQSDSLRFYYLGKQWQTRIEHFGAKKGLDLNGPLIL